MLDIPYPIYVSEKYVQSQNKLGFHYPKDTWTSEIPVKVVSEATQKASIQNFIPSLWDFRTKCRDCFFLYDGHLKPEGQKFFAQLVGSKLENILSPSEK